MKGPLASGTAMRPVTESCWSGGAHAYALQAAGARRVRYTKKTYLPATAEVTSK